jgi:hypothetical protein
MRNLGRLFLGLAVIQVGSVAFAQSSGNFASEIQTAQCSMAVQDGALSGGSTKQAFATTIKTPNDSKTTLIITPSLLTGLYTNSFINADKPMDNESAAVVVSVLFDGKPVLPLTDANPEVVFDQRFQQISTHVFEAIDECDGEERENCDFSMIQSTLSAHSFNFIVPSPGVGTHDVVVNWRIQCTHDGEPAECVTTPANSTAAACVGPGVLTVQQVKAFSQSGGITVN